jgi:hypothetical protein
VNSHEDAFVSAFIIPEKRDRYAQFLRQPKRRQEILRRFNHFFDFVPQFATPIPRDSPEQLAAVLRRYGAGATAHVLGGPEGVDGCELPLIDALDAAIRAPGGIVVSCIPGSLALHLEEFPPGHGNVLRA